MVLAQSAQSAVLVSIQHHGWQGPLGGQCFCGAVVEKREIRRGLLAYVYKTIADIRQSIGVYLDFFNTERRYQLLDRQTLNQVYYQSVDRMVT